MPTVNYPVTKEEKVETIGPLVLGVVGSNFHLVPEKIKKNLRKRLNSFLYGSPRVTAADYALVSLDREIGPWACNTLHDQGIPFVVVIPILLEKDLTSKYRYWIRKAANVVYTPTPEESDFYYPGPLHANIKITPSQRAIVARNKYIIENSQQLILVTPHPQHITTHWSVTFLSDQMKTVLDAYGSRDFQRHMVDGSKPVWVPNEKLIRIGFDLRERSDIREWQYQRKRSLSKRSKGSVNPRTGIARAYEGVRWTPSSVTVGGATYPARVYPDGSIAYGPDDV